MNLNTAKFLVKATELFGNQEIDLREDYSGRSMYGRTTAAIVVDSFPQLLTDVLNYMRECVGEYESEDGTVFHETWDGELLTEEIEGLRTDNMGMGIVLY